MLTVPGNALRERDDNNGRSHPVVTPLEWDSCRAPDSVLGKAFVTDSGASRNRGRLRRTKPLLKNVRTFIRVSSREAFVAAGMLAF